MERGDARKKREMAHPPLPELTAPEHDPALMEKAARAIHGTWCRSSHHLTEFCQKALASNDRDRALVFFDAVADDLRAEGQTEAIRRGTLSWEQGYRAGYRRGMVAGARQVHAAVEQAHEDVDPVTDQCEWLPEYCHELVAAREALARIEGDS